MVTICGKSTRSANANFGGFPVVDNNWTVQLLIYLFFRVTTVRISIFVSVIIIELLYKVNLFSITTVVRYLLKRVNKLKLIYTMFFKPECPLKKSYVRPIWINLTSKQSLTGYLRHDGSGPCAQHHSQSSLFKKL